MILRGSAGLLVLVALFTVTLLSPARADRYLGIAHGYVTQDIGIQAQNDTPLDDLCATGKCTYRGGDGSKVQSDRVAGFFGGWRRGPWAMELGYTDLGTWPLTDYATTSTGTTVVRSNITMSAWHVSGIRYFGGLYARLGLHHNRTVARSVERVYQGGEWTSRTYQLSADKDGLLYGLGYAHDFGPWFARIEYQRFEHVGVIDMTGTTSPRGWFAAIGIKLP